MSRFNYLVSRDNYLVSRDNIHEIEIISHLEVADIRFRRGLILHRMLSKDIFEASFLLLSHYPKRVSKEIANIYNWKINPD